MTTITTKRLPDPDDDSIEASLRRFESTLRFWSPLLLGPARSIAPFAYSGAIALSTIIGYALFFIPSFFIATIISDIITNVSLLTTVTQVLMNISLIGSILTSNMLIVFIAGLSIYIMLLVTYEPIQPNGTADALHGTQQWEDLKRSLYVCIPLFAVSAVYGILTTAPLSFIITGLSAWWIMRRIAFTVIFDETRYVFSPPLTEVLLVTRIPTVIGFFAVVTGYPIIGSLLLAVPFIGALWYLNWRGNLVADETKSTDTTRMAEKSGLPQDFVQDLSASGAYKANANDRLLRSSIKKFNSFLDTEIDTEERVNIQDSRLDVSDIRSVISQTEDIYEDFNDVAYRPERFEEIVHQIEKYGQQYINTLEEDEEYEAY